MEQEAREAAGVTRGQNAVYVMPHDWTSISQFLGPLLERVDDAAHELQLLIVTSDAEAAAAVTAAAVKLTTGRAIGIMAATSAKRAARLIRVRPAQVVAGPPETLVELLKGAAIKLDAVRSVCIAWADELIARGSTPSLETVMIDVPKDSGRTVVTAEPPAHADQRDRRADARLLCHGVDAFAFGSAPSPLGRNRPAIGAGFCSRRGERGRSPRTSRRSRLRWKR